MTDEYLGYIILLEKTLASYYARIKNLPRLEGARAVLEFMEVHSFEHAAIIEEDREKYRRPALRESMITDFQNNLTEKVFERISSENDILNVLGILAESEEALGKMYRSVAAFLETMAEHYSAVARELGKLADDEFNHRDLLLKDRERLARKES